MDVYLTHVLELTIASKDFKVNVHHHLVLEAISGFEKENIEIIIQKFVCSSQQHIQITIWQYDLV